ncbi:hypothetical protein Pmani_028796 [Petrolisthes manimaculis]|uniref:Uncharacterized protein n=1 Tax=Petrolisthes manimaculis TaxID=1843537 RepID=A0AAE1TXN3_9EUCA|nr:hypothetical protein Pmani_028796 [Petrolisthes manimaculis]
MEATGAKDTDAFAGEVIKTQVDGDEFARQNSVGYPLGRPPDDDNSSLRSGAITAGNGSMRTAGHPYLLMTREPTLHSGILGILKALTAEFSGILKALTAEFSGISG